MIIDGRIADICETGFLDGTLVVPQFVLRELQQVADSSDSLKRNRGRRGLDILQKIQKMADVTVQIVETDFPEIREVDLKLIELARRMSGKIVTNDFNLNKVAQLRGVPVLNINELANSLKPVVLPGELMRVFVIKEGKEAGQGVAYLDDGTMVVVDQASKALGRTIEVSVTSVLQTTAGKMIFCRWPDAATVEDPASRNSRVGDRRDPRPARDLRAPERRENERRDGVTAHPAGRAGARGRDSSASTVRTRRSRWTSRRRRPLDRSPRGQGRVAAWLIAALLLAAGASAAAAAAEARPAAAAHRRHPRPARARARVLGVEVRSVAHRPRPVRAERGEELQARVVAEGGHHRRRARRVRPRRALPDHGGDGRPPRRPGADGRATSTSSAAAIPTCPGDSTRAAPSRPSSSWPRRWRRRASGASRGASSGTRGCSPATGGARTGRGATSSGATGPRSPRSALNDNCVDLTVGARRAARGTRS